MPRVHELENDHFNETEELLNKINCGRSGSSLGETLIVKINNYLKKPHIEHALSPLLDSYLQAIKQKKMEFKDGVFSTSLPEASLVLQSSVLLYAKKVDLLWNNLMEYNARVNSYELTPHETETEVLKLEQSKEKPTKKHKPVESSKDQCCNSKQDYLSYDEFLKILSSDTSIIPETFPCEESTDLEMPQLKNKLVLYEVEPAEFNICEASENREQIGNYASSAIFDHINDQFYSHYLHLREGESSSHLSSSEKQEAWLQHEIVDNDVRLDDIYQNWDYFMERYNSYSQKIDSNAPNDTHQNRCSGESAGFCSSNEISDLTLCEQTDQSMLREKRLTCDSDIESGVFGSNKSVSTSEEAINSLKDSRSITPMSNASVDHTIEEFSEVACRPKRTPKRTFHFTLDLLQMNEIFEVKPKKKRPSRVKMVSIATVEEKRFSSFYNKHYTPGKDEGCVDALATSECGDENNIFEDFYSSDPVTSTPSIKDRLPSVTHAKEGQSLADVMNDETSMKLKEVLEWKKFITNKISKVNKADFDVHVVEDQIINVLGEMNATKKFTDICAHPKTPSNSAHTFMAMLHLCSTNNVELRGVQLGELSNKTLELKLISHDRHHEHLHEYNKHIRKDYSINESSPATSKNKRGGSFLKNSPSKKGKSSSTKHV